MNTFYICGNTETIIDGCGHDFGGDNVAEEEVAIAFANAADRVIRDFMWRPDTDCGEYDISIDSNFARWHGETHTRRNATGYRVGLVRCDASPCPQWAKDLVDAAVLAGDAARDAAIALEVESLKS